MAKTSTRVLSESLRALDMRRTLASGLLDVAGQPLAFQTKLTPLCLHALDVLRQAIVLQSFRALVTTMLQWLLPCVHVCSILLLCTRTFLGGSNALGRFGDGGRVSLGTFFLLACSVREALVPRIALFA